jgi:hypothetical protein
MYHIAADAVVILDVFKKQTEGTGISFVCPTMSAGLLKPSWRSLQDRGNGENIWV